MLSNSRLGPALLSSESADSHYVIHIKQRQMPTGNREGNTVMKSSAIRRETMGTFWFLELPVHMLQENRS